MTQRNNHTLVGWLCVAAGAFILATAAGLIPVPEEDINAPTWVIALCGLVFLVGGVMAFAGTRSRLNSLFAAILCGAFGAIGAWVTFFSPAESISGGVPFLAQSTNAAIGRWVFGFGTLITLGIGAIALREFLRGTKK
mgnify:CR=1 FL=1